MATRSCTKCHKKHLPPTGKRCQYEDSANHDGTAAILAAITGLREDMGQLNARMDTLEEAASDDTVSIRSRPPRATDPLQEKVVTRMADLNLLHVDSDDLSEDEDATPRRRRATRGKKSGRARTAEDLVVRDIAWPHYPVYLGPERRAAKYAELTPEQFVYGFLHNMKREAPAVQQIMKQHLQDLMQDAMEYGWDNARAYHGLLLQQFEMNRLTWQDTPAIELLRRTYAQRAPSAQPPTKPAAGKEKVAGAGTLYCAAYQLGSCQQTGDHSSPRGFVRHICAYCLKTTTATFPHPESDCRRKSGKSTGQTKNGAAAGDAQQ